MADAANSVIESEIEEWRDIPGWEGLYQASSLGRIRSLDRYHKQKMRDGSIQTVLYRGKIRSPHINKSNGYLMVGISRPGGGRKTAVVHQLVCEAFNGARPNGYDTAHNDGNKLNNSATNLRWATRTDNSLDKRKHGTHVAGERHGAAKFSNDDIVEMFKMRDGGAQHKVIAAKFGAHVNYIARIMRGVRRKNG